MFNAAAATAVGFASLAFEAVWANVRLCIYQYGISCWLATVKAKLDAAWMRSSFFISMSVMKYFQCNCKFHLNNVEANRRADPCTFKGSTTYLYIYILSDA